MRERGLPSEPEVRSGAFEPDSGGGSRTALSRRGVLVATTWAVPVLAVAGATPAMAASTDTLEFTDTTWRGGDLTGTATLLWTGVGSKPDPADIAASVSEAGVVPTVTDGDDDTFVITFTLPAGYTGSQVTVFASMPGVAQVSKVINTPPAGTTDTAFATNLGTGFNQNVEALTLQADGKAVVGGRFTLANGTFSTRLARVNLNGSIDTAFSAAIGSSSLGAGGLNGAVFALAVQPNGGIIAGGEFTTASGAGSVGLARYKPDGTVDTVFAANLGTGFTRAGNPGSNAAVRGIATQADNKILVSGLFLEFAGSAVPGLVRLNSDGTRDMSFAPTLSAGGGLYVQPDGKILVGRNGNPPQVIRLNSGGTIDPTFTSTTLSGNGSLNVIAPAPGGGFLIGGIFGVARILANGGADPAFTNPGISNGIWAIAVLADGTFIAGGQFGAGPLGAYVTRLNGDGSLKKAMTASNTVFVGAQRPDNGAVLLGGVFTSIEGVTSYRLAQLTP